MKLYAELILIVFVIIIATFIISNIDIFKIKDKNNYVAIKNLLIYINHRYSNYINACFTCKIKLNILFSNNVTPGLFG